MSFTNSQIDDAPFTYEGGDLLQIAMPLGGIGAGSVCLNGYGGLQDFSIRNKPATTATPDNHGFAGAAFALLHIKGAKPTTKLIEGPMPIEGVYARGLHAQGYRKGGHEGLPRFESCRFVGKYPFGQVELSDGDVPLAVSIRGWNPFIPLDAHNSGIPCAILEYTFTNPTAKAVEFEFSYHVSHWAVGSKGDNGTRSAVIPGAGIYFTNTETPNHETFGSAALTVIGHEPVIKGEWFRGGWFDGITALWREVSTGTFTANAGSSEAEHGRNGGSLLIAGSLAPGESVTCPIALSWHFPNVHYSVGVAECAPGESCDCAPAEGDTSDPAPKWRPYYASQWADARAVALYVSEHYRSLRERTEAFQAALFSSTLPAYVLDAISANLAILKSPTVLRQEDGNLWAWEGCFADSGCCHGSCTHVWNYAQALPHLFPALERTLREQEYRYSQDSRGHVNFRSALPMAATTHNDHAAADGQLGGILKVYRDWQIGGDTEWMRGLYPLVKRSIDYGIQLWDPDRQGALIEPHHNTYDIEFWGPDGMCTSIYVAALTAMAAMAHATDNASEATSYKELAAKGAEYLDSSLFNGEYFEQKVMWEGLRDQSFAGSLAKAAGRTDERSRILRTEGPKYQYGEGCLSDGVIGAWMAKIYGVETPQTRANIVKHLQAIYRYNFQEDLFDHACLQRPGYALGHEPGLLLCSWPRGNKPTLPFVYSDEVWTGIEYQVASHMIEEGLVDEGLRIVESVRRRYSGHNRNPWNEYECGSYYARAMSSYALLGSLSGFRYSAVEKTLWFAPKLDSDPFQTFFSTASGYGTICLAGGELTITMLEGELAIERLIVQNRAPLPVATKVTPAQATSVDLSSSPR